jgi:hypothetical protein
MLPVVVSVACYTSDLDHPSQSLGEKWLSLAEDRGGISFIGATELTEFFYSDTLGKHSIFGYFNRSALTIGAALNYGKMQMYNSFQGGSGSITEETMQQFLLFGDPTLMPWTNIPSLMQVDFKKHLTPGVHNISIKVSSDSIPVQNALVCLSTANFKYHQSLYTDSLGNVAFNLNADSNSVYYLTVSGYNLVTFEDSIRFDTLNSIPSQLSNANISIYPNPVSDNCTISGHTPGRLIECIDITDMNGRLITSFNNIHSYSFTFEKAAMKPGIYFIRITDSSGLYQIRRIAVK